MDLKIKDVADLLHLSETTIRRWLVDGKIPAYRINHQYRFSRIEIEDWMMKHKLRNSHEEAVPFNDPLFQEEQSLSSRTIKRSPTGRKQFSLYRAIHLGGVFYGIPGDTKEMIISNTLKLLAKPLGLDADVLADLFLDREGLMPTALNNGIGVPHTREALLKSHQDAVAVVFLEKPISYGALDGQPVHTLFFLLASEDKSHLHLLAKIAHLSSQDASLNLFKQHPSKTQLLEYVKEWEKSTAHQSP